MPATTDNISKRKLTEFDLNGCVSIIFHEDLGLSEIPTSSNVVED